MIFAIDGSSFLKLIDEQNTLRIPKYGDQNLAWWCLCFGRFEQLSPDAVHSADWWFDSGVKWWNYVLSIVTYLRKSPFCCIKTVANNALNRWCVVVFDRLWANAAPILNTAFSSKNVNAKWWIHCLLISPTPLLSHVFNLRSAKRSLCSFGCFPGLLSNLGDLGVRHHLCLNGRV